MKLINLQENCSYLNFAAQGILAVDISGFGCALRINSVDRGAKKNETSGGSALLFLARAIRSRRGARARARARAAARRIAVLVPDPEGRWRVDLGQARWKDFDER